MITAEIKYRYDGCTWTMVKHLETAFDLAEFLEAFGKNREILSYQYETWQNVDEYWNLKDTGRAYKFLKVQNGLVAKRKVRKTK